MKTRTCTSCGVEKPIERFYRRLAGWQYRCKACASADSKRRRETDPTYAAKKSRWDRRHYEKNRDSIKAKTRDYAKQHVVQQNALKADWKKRNPEKNRDINANYRRENREFRRLYNVSYFASRPGHRATLEHRRRALEISAFVEDVQPALVYERDMGLCQICGLPVEAGEFHLDHGIPLARGGEHSYSNCQTAHARCNVRKHMKLPGECLHLWMR